jgi:hypothetical protein
MTARVTARVTARGDSLFGAQRLSGQAKLIS